MTRAVGEPSHRLRVAVATLGLAGLSSCLFALQLFFGKPYVVENNVAIPFRLGGLVAVLLSPLASGGLSYLWAKRRGADGVVALARRLMPTLLLWALPILFVREPWKGEELVFFVYAAAIVLVLERLLRPSLEAASLSLKSERLRRILTLTERWAPPLVVALAMCWYFGWVSHYTLLSHQRLATATADLGEFDNLFFNALHGQPFRAPATDGDVRTWSALKVHAEFLLYLLLPFYAISPGPRALLVIQTALVAATALPIYLFGARRLGPPLGAVLAVAMLLLPATQQPNFYDFHFHPVGMLCAAWLLYSVDVYLAAKARARQANEAERQRSLRRPLTWVIVTAALTLLAREDVAFGVCVIGLLLMWSGLATKLGLGLFLVSGIYFGCMKFLIMPLFGKMWFSIMYQDLWAPGARSFAAILLTLTTHPAYVVTQLLTEPRLLYLLHLSVPLAFLWFRKPWLLLAALPALPFSLLATNRIPLNQISFQYVYGWVPYVFAASVIGLESLGSAARRWSAALALVVVSVASSFQFGALLGADKIRGGFSDKALSISAEESARTARLEALIAAIPRDASVTATLYEGPHLSTRLDFFPIQRAPALRPDYIVARGLFESADGKDLKLLLDTGEYGVEARQGEFTLFRRGADPATLESLLPRAPSKKHKRGS